MIARVLAGARRGGGPLFVWYMAALLAVPALGMAETVRLTMYDDGLSCPNDCDAHVVFHPSLNGTEFAHDPSTPAAPHAPCVEGKPCRICIESGGRQCLTATYRGAGPTRMTFDLTTDFYEAKCPDAANPPELATKCRELAAAARKLDGRTNCIRTREDPKCSAMMRAARAAQEADRVQYDDCRRSGERAYNERHTPAEQRSNACAYERHGTGGPNRNGTTWRRLLPGACRTGGFVGRDGLDCCNGRPFADGPLGVECRGFYPQ